MFAAASHSIWFILAAVVFGVAAFIRAVAKPVEIDAVLVAVGLAVLAAGLYFGLPAVGP